MPFDKDAELDPRLTGVPLSAIHERYEHQYAGSQLTGMMKKHSQDPDDAKTAVRIDKAIKAALAELEVLVGCVPTDGTEELPGDVGNDKLLLEIYWRLHDGWKADAAPELKMIDLEGSAPSWSDVIAIFSELEALDHDGGDGDSFPSAWYDDLLTRFETRLGRLKPKKKAVPKKAAPVIKEPPADAVFIDYSPKATFQVGQWVRHPKFGVGYVVEVGQHAMLEFGADRKLLAHVAAVLPPIEPKMRPRRGGVDSSELARAAGIEIKKVPARFEGEE